MSKLLDTLRLIRSKNVGNYAFFEAIKIFGSAKNALNSLPNILTQSQKPKFALCSVEAAKQEIEKCKQLGVQIIAYDDPSYPTLLHHLGHNRPPILMCIGNLSLLNRLSVAVVGSRTASLNGLGLTTKLVRQLGELCITIVSGLALGVDTAAHKASLETGTIAVLGCGVNKIFPPRNKELYYQIAEKGLLVSTLPIDTPPLAHNFPARNQYISGLSLGTLVVEAKAKSGSLITAEHALQQGRDVFAVPGSPNDSGSAGANKLLKSGAILVEDIADMVECINKWKNDFNFLQEDRLSVSTSQPVVLNDDLLRDAKDLKAQILPLLSTTPISYNLLRQHLSCSDKLLALALLELELIGKIQRLAGNKIKLLNYND